MVATPPKVIPIIAPTDILPEDSLILGLLIFELHLSV